MSQSMTKEQTWERDQLEKVKNNPKHIKRLRKRQTEAIALAAVQQDGELLKYVLEPTEAICLAAIEETVFSVQYVPEHLKTERIRKAALEKNVFAIQYFSEVTEEEQWNCLRLTGAVLQYLKHPTQEMIEYAVSKDGSNLKFVEHQTERLCYRAIRSYPMALSYCKTMNPRLQLEALKLDANLISLVTQPTEEMALEIWFNATHHLAMTKSFVQTVSIFLWETSEFVSEINKRKWKTFVEDKWKNLNKHYYFSDALYQLKCLREGKVGETLPFEQAIEEDPFVIWLIPMIALDYRIIRFAESVCRRKHPELVTYLALKQSYQFDELI